MSTMMETYQNITRRTDDNKSVINKKKFYIFEEVKNDYYTERLAIIPADTEIIADFACDSGMYGMVEVEGVLHKVKVPLEELHKINFGKFEKRHLA